ncbi:MAG: hypothetical protein WC578_00620 [Candidatus Omnitrophota bacterium]
MKKLFFLLLMNISLSATCLYAGYDLEKYFPTGQKDIWAYSMVEHDIGQEAGKNEAEIGVEVRFLKDGTGNDLYGPIRMLIKYSDGERNEYSISKDSEGIKVSKFVKENNYYSVFEPPFLLLPSKINEGETKEYSGIITYFDSDKEKGKAKIKRELTANGLEDVETKAGVFKNCVRIYVKEVINKENGEVKNKFYTFWFSPEAGEVKEVVRTITFRLAENEYKKTSSDESTMELKRTTVNGRSFGN